MTVELERTGDTLRVRVPDHPRFLQFARLVLAKREGDTWIFDLAYEPEVRALVRFLTTARVRDLPRTESA